MRSSTDIASDVADTFFDIIFKHHGVPENIVSDREPKFESYLWRRIIERDEGQLEISTNEAQQTDGASTNMKRMAISSIGRSNYHNDWNDFLQAGESTYHSSVTMGLDAFRFELDFG